ncbi:hypothetical protein CR513_23662, partial [Mucuna pruriens]
MKKSACLMFELCDGGKVDDEWCQTTSLFTECKVYGRDQETGQIREFFTTLASNKEDWHGWTWKNNTCSTDDLWREPLVKWDKLWSGLQLLPLKYAHAQA